MTGNSPIQGLSVRPLSLRLRASGKETGTIEVAAHLRPRPPLGADRGQTSPGETALTARPRAHGKFLYVGDDKLYVKGVTYGTFEDGYPARDVVARDFAEMAATGVNSVRIYTVPPRWLLDLASEHGLYLLVGLPWEEHVAFLDDPERAASIEARVREGVRACAGHPAVLAYTVGNEIPSSIVRWHGRRRIEKFLHRLYRAVKQEDPEALVTYVNYPSTEYLQLPFVDFLCFNVYLEAEELLDAYLARLQNLADEQPLIIAELGLDSSRHGEDAQAIALGWQLRTSFAAGCAGAFVFAWTDEWHRGEFEVLDWDFGLVDRDRAPKRALAAVRDVFAAIPFRADLSWPRVTVAVCAHNEEARIRECLEAVTALDYPEFETIVVDDGSSDATAAIAGEFDVTLLSGPNEGLAAARNRALAAATGDLIAYLDADAAPDPHWLQYLAAAFMTTPHAGIGGPNIPPPDGLVARCVGLAPGGPTHVLLSDRDAEHIPGCNMAFRVDALRGVGGFDPQFRTAGDDVDICWRLHDHGWTLGFSPAAVVWHYRRASIRAYLRQQRGYGKAEALLERKWPEKYNRGGHVSWNGRLYGGASGRRRPWRVYYGPWGNAPFQSALYRGPGTLATLPLMPEWYLLVALLVLLDALVLAVPFLPALAPTLGLGLALAATGAVAGRSALTAAPGAGPRVHVLTALLYLLQPSARLWGRFREGLTPWRRRRALRPGLPWTRSGSVWSESWRPLERWLGDVYAELRSRGLSVERGGVFDRWDMHVRAGPSGGARLRVTLEEHGAGRQLLRYRIHPRLSRGGTAIVAALCAFGAGSLEQGAVTAGAVLLVLTGLLAVRILHEAGAAIATVAAAVEGSVDTPVRAVPAELLERIPLRSRSAEALE